MFHPVSRFHQTACSAFTCTCAFGLNFLGVPKLLGMGYIKSIVVFLFFMLKWKLCRELNNVATSVNGLLFSTSDEFLPELGCRVIIRYSV